MTVSLVIETWNTGGDATELRRQLRRLAPQLAAHADEVVITYVARERDAATRDAALDATTRAQLAALVPCSLHWVELPASAGYYDHKNRGFDASTGDVVAFIDGDCDPDDHWLAALLAPFATGAQVAAGATSYPGELAALANELDFPYFDGADARNKFDATSTDVPPTVRNFFANNVAFTREAFAARRYPTITPMFHGQCQVLALQLLAARVPISYAAAARVTHAWPESLVEWVQVRLLRGADMTQLLPHLLGTYAPRTRAPIERLGAVPALGALPALAVLGWRAVTASWSALTRRDDSARGRGGRRGQVARGLALVAGVTAVDAIGAAAAPVVYRYVAP